MGVESIQVKYDMARQHLDQCQKILHANPHDTIASSQEYQANKEYREVASQYYSWLQQKAKIHWLQAGDSNSKIIYNSLKTRTNKNTVK
ncbi:Malolactic enzyme [Bienertia sinuspersici]